MRTYKFYNVYIRINNQVFSSPTFKTRKGALNWYNKINFFDTDFRKVLVKLFIETIDENGWSIKLETEKLGGFLKEI